MLRIENYRIFVNNPQDFMHKHFSKKLFLLNTSFNRYRALFEGKALLKGGIIHGNTDVGYVYIYKGLKWAVLS